MTTKVCVSIYLTICVTNVYLEPFYNDFFAPPSKAAAKGKGPATPQTDGGAKKAGVRFHNEVRVKNIKAKGKNMSLPLMYDLGEDDSDEEEGGMSDGEEDEDEEGSKGEEYGGVYDENEDVEMASQSGDEEDATRETIERLKDDLFADDEEEEDKGMLSTLPHLLVDVLTHHRIIHA